MSQELEHQEHKTVFKYEVKLEVDPYTFKVLDMLSVEEIKENIKNKLEQQLLKIRDGLIKTGEFNRTITTYKPNKYDWVNGFRVHEIEQESTYLIIPFTFEVD